MHVLFLPSWYSIPSNPVLGSFFQEQAIALLKSGVKVGVIYIRQDSVVKWLRRDSPKGIHRGYNENPPVIRFFAPRIPKASFLNSWIMIMAGFLVFREYIRKHGRPDVVHVHAMENSGRLALEIMHRYGIPYIITEHSTKYARELISGKKYEELIQVVLGSSNLLAVSREFCHLLDTLFRQRPGTWEYLPNIVSNRFLEAPLSAARASKKTRYVTIAFLTKKKAIDLLLDAFSQAFSPEEPVELAIGGDGIELPRLKAQVRRLGIGNQVTFLGSLSREQVVAEISASDFLVVPSLNETFGVVVIEALALGRPVLATRCGGPESIVEPEDGELVDRGNVEALIVGLRKMLERKAEFNSAEIRRRCAARFGESVIASKLIEKYEQIVYLNYTTQK